VKKCTKFVYLRIGFSGFCRHDDESSGTANEEIPFTISVITKLLEEGLVPYMLFFGVTGWSLICENASRVLIAATDE
jgi:hypothetical protein